MTDNEAGDAPAPSEGTPAEPETPKSLKPRKPRRKKAKAKTKRAPKKMGRPSALTKEREDTFVNCMRAGGFIKHAAGVIGVAEVTVYVWLERGEAADVLENSGQDVPKDELPYLSFFRRVRQAQATFRMDGVIKIKQAGAVDWRATAWLLEKLSPNEFGNRTKLEHSGPNGAPIPVAQASLSLDELVAISKTQKDNSCPTGAPSTSESKPDGSSSPGSPTSGSSADSSTSFERTDSEESSD